MIQAMRLARVISRIMNREIKKNNKEKSSKMPAEYSVSSTLTVVMLFVNKNITGYRLTAIVEKSGIIFDFICIRLTYHLFISTPIKIT